MTSFVEPATTRQVQAVNARLSSLGVTDRAERLRVCRAVLHHDVTSTKDLTRDDARAVLSVLDWAQAEDRPRAALDAMVAQNEAVMRA